MRNVLSAVIGLLWGGWMLLYRVRNGFDDVAGPYRTGQYIGFAFGLLMFGGGCYYAYRTFEEFRDRPRRRKRIAEIPEEAKPAPADLRTRYLTSGVVGILLGGFIEFNLFSQGGPQGTGAYRTGQWIALLMGLLMISGGVYYLWKASNDSPRRRSKQKRPQAKPPAARRQPPTPPGANGLPPRMPPRSGGR